MGRVVHFEVLADDPERAARFYGDVFGWQVERWEGPVEYWLAGTGPDDAPGIHGAIVRREGPREEGTPSGYVCSIGVDDLDSVVEVAQAAGARMVSGKAAVPGVGWVARLRDPEGNLVGLLEADETAA